MKAAAAIATHGNVDALRVQVVASIRENLVAHLPGDSAPIALEFAGCVAEIATQCETMADQILSPRAAGEYLKLVERLVRGLHFLGPERVAGSFAEQLAMKHAARADRLFAATYSVGRA